MTETVKQEIHFDKEVSQCSFQIIELCGFMCIHTISQSLNFMDAERLDVILLSGKKASPFEMLWGASFSA